MATLIIFSVNSSDLRPGLFRGQEHVHASAWPCLRSYSRARGAERAVGPRSSFSQRATGTVALQSREFQIRPPRNRLSGKRRIIRLPFAGAEVIEKSPCKRSARARILARPWPPIV